MDQERFCVKLSAEKIKKMILYIDIMKRNNFCSLNLLIRSFKRVKFDLILCVLSKSQVISQCNMVQLPASYWQFIFRMN